MFILQNASNLIDYSSFLISFISDLFISKICSKAEYHNVPMVFSHLSNTRHVLSRESQEDFGDEHHREEFRSRSQLDQHKSDPTNLLFTLGTDKKSNCTKIYNWRFSGKGDDRELHPTKQALRRFLHRLEHTAKVNIISIDINDRNIILSQLDITITDHKRSTSMKSHRTPAKHFQNVITR